MKPPTDNLTTAIPLEIPTDADLLTTYLKNRDAPCPACGYNLRSLTSPRCPECGRELRLSIGTAEPFLRAWITLAGSCCCTAGIGLFLLGITAIERRWPFIHESLTVNVIGVYFMLSPLAVAGVVRYRRRFTRAAPRIQWRLAVTHAAVSLACFVVFFAAIR